MKIALDACLVLAKKTIYADNFSNAKPIEDTNPDISIYGTDEMVFKFSSDIESLRKEYMYSQEVLHTDDTVPGPYAFVTNSSLALLILEVLGYYK